MSQALQTLTAALAERTQDSSGVSLFNKISNCIDDVVKIGEYVLEKAKTSSLYSSTNSDQLLDDFRVNLENISCDIKTKTEDSKFDAVFLDKVLRPMSILMRYLNDCLKYPVPAAVENFRSAYKEYAELVNIILIQLENKSSDPMVLSMKSDCLKTRTTFDRWYDIINGMLGQVLLLESFASTFLYSGPNQNLVDRSRKLLATVDSWQEDYIMCDYWNALKQEVEKFQDENGELGVSEKAGKLKMKLDDLLTKDSFYFLVLDPTEAALLEFYAKNQDQLIESSNHSIIIIYRSKYADTADTSMLGSLKSQFETLKNNEIKENPLDQEFIKGKLKDRMRHHMENSIHDAGFICVFSGIKGEIGSANFEQESGPGFSEILKMEFNGTQHGFVVGYN
ncbi:hypothetical protein B9Z55_003270 [Caenorhabditis nigoni]|uniref:Uncharacterized protein n=1 Tax=Caenorhabditis nigoni TaxID=1611254 RepID=A0A2G5VPG6_9PELO|nr:hypothetical protein B9Z55_003270 [Caenorhabditis nigoni]